MKPTTECDKNANGAFGAVIVQCDQIWRNIATLAKSSNWQIYDGLFTIWQKFEPTLANFVHFWANFH